MNSYNTVDHFIGWDKSINYFRNFISENDIVSVLEIGAGANPTLPLDFIKENNIKYTINDENGEELEKTPSEYNKMIFDLSSSVIKSDEKYDLIFSRMTGEHIKNPEILHSNIFGMLKPGGYSVHCFSTLYALPFFINKLLPGALSEKILKIFAPRNEHHHGKFSAFYKWAYGPVKPMINNYERLGFIVEKYYGYFGHYYYNKIGFLQKLENIKSEFLVKHPIPWLTSYAVTILKKPVNY